MVELEHIEDHKEHYDRVVKPAFEKWQKSRDIKDLRAFAKANAQNLNMLLSGDYVNEDMFE